MALFDFGKKKRGNEPAVPQPKKEPATMTPEEKAEDLFSRGKVFYDRKDYSAAAPYFREAAELGNQKAQNDLGLMYEKG